MIYKLDFVLQDMDTVDSTLPYCSRSFVGTALNVLMTIVVILYATPTFGAVIPVLSTVYYIVLVNTGCLNLLRLFCLHPLNNIIIFLECMMHVLFKSIIYLALLTLI